MSFDKNPKSIHLKQKPLISAIQQQGENIKLKAQLEHLNVENGFDPLTKLLNDKALQAKIEEQRHDIRSTATKIITFAFIDLDNLKKINDKFGHAVGDKYIKVFAAKLRNHFRKNDYIYRVKGSQSDEFGILTESDQVDFLTNELNIFNANNKAFSFSFGVQSGVRDTNGKLDLENVIHQADLLMYEQKTAKRINGVK